MGSRVPSVPITWPEPRQLPEKSANGPSVRATPICGPSSAAPAKLATNSRVLGRERPERAMLDIDTIVSVERLFAVRGADRASLRVDQPDPPAATHQIRDRRRRRV